jgi:hypothetical protein
MSSMLGNAAILAAGDGNLGLTSVQAVWDLDPTWDSVFLITAGADSKVILWEVETGVALVEVYELP